MANKKEKILITGGEGLIGTALTKRLLEDGYKVMSYDALLNFADNPKYYKRCMAFRNKLYPNKKAQKVKGDIRKVSDLRNSVESFNPDIIVHLGAISMARVSDKHKSKMIPINMQGTFNVLDVFEKSSAKKIVYTSSSMAYGHFKQTPQSEDFILDPINTYGAAKAAGEYFTKLSNKKWVIIRPTSVYGFADCANRVTQLLLDAANGKRNAWVAKGEKLDFSYIDDVVDGFHLAIFSDKANYQTLNISRGEARSLVEFAEELKKYFPDFEYEVRDPLTDVPFRGPLDISKARKLLGYKPKYDIENGIEEIIKLCEKHDFYNY